MELINLLQQMTQSGATKCERLFRALTQEEQDKVLSWYIRYCGSKNVVVVEMLQLMLYFFERDNLEFHNDVEFTKAREMICERYGIAPNAFLDVYTSFRELISQ